MDGVIDHLHKDKKSLLSCTLTCRSWLPRSTQVYFRALPVRRSWQVRPPDVDHAGDSDQMSQFLRTLQTSPRLALYASVLHLEFSFSLRKCWPESSLLEVVSFVHDVVGAAQNLDSLSIEFKSFTEMSQEPTYPPRAPHPQLITRNIRQLCIKHCLPKSADHLLQPFRSVQNLVLRLELYKDIPLPPVSEKYAVKNLHLELCIWDAVAGDNALLQLPTQFDPEVLRTASVKVIRTGITLDVSRIIDFVAAVGRNIDHLAFDNEWYAYGTLASLAPRTGTRFPHVACHHMRQY